MVQKLRLEGLEAEVGSFGGPEAEVRRLSF